MVQKIGEYDRKGVNLKKNGSNLLETMEYRVRYFRKKIFLLTAVSHKPRKWNVYGGMKDHSMPFIEQKFCYFSSLHNRVKYISCSWNSFKFITISQRLFFLEQHLREMKQRNTARKNAVESSGINSRHMAFDAAGNTRPEICDRTFMSTIIIDRTGIIKLYSVKNMNLHKPSGY